LGVGTGLGDDEFAVDALRDVAVEAAGRIVICAWDAGPGMMMNE
jgi:hypothetical protein